MILCSNWGISKNGLIWHSKNKGLIIKEINTMIPKNTDITFCGLWENTLCQNSRKGGRSSYGTQILTYGEYVLFRGRESYI